jgi:hypothetical protein
VQPVLVNGGACLLTTEDRQLVSLLEFTVRIPQIDVLADLDILCQLDVSTLRR